MNLHRPSLSYQIFQGSKGAGSWRVMEPRQDGMGANVSLTFNPDGEKSKRIHQASSSTSLQGRFTLRKGQEHRDF